MGDKRAVLVSSIKHAVAKHGIAGLTTRNVAEVAGISDSHLYRFFKNMDGLLLAAYEEENSAIFDSSMVLINEIHDIRIDFKSKVHLQFHRIWTELLSDPDRLVFCVSFFHSNYLEMAKDFHNSQLKMLTDRLSCYFKDEETCVRAMYAMLSFLYESAEYTVRNHVENTPEYEDQEFNAYFNLLSSYIEEQK